ncbi:MAG: class IV adenylate cyclase [Promethearchaeota archaeon]
MIEVEIKARILNADEMKKKFERKEGEYKLSLIHEDTYFNMPKNLRDFKKTDEALRIRKSIEYKKNDKSYKGKKKYYITYKGKKIDTITKTRKELESKLSNGEEMKEILGILGFQEIFTVKKERDLYEFNFKDHHITALIDYIPRLKQNFIEVEIIIESTENLEEARQILFDFLSLFDIKKEDSIQLSYLELIADRFRGKIRR